jgi:hypothetical protein
VYFILTGKQKSPAEPGLMQSLRSPFQASMRFTLAERRDTLRDAVLL